MSIAGATPVHTRSDVLPTDVCRPEVATSHARSQRSIGGAPARRSVFRQLTRRVSYTSVWSLCAPVSIGLWPNTVSGI